MGVRHRPHGRRWASATGAMYAIKARGRNRFALPRTPPSEGPRLPRRNSRLRRLGATRGCAASATRLSLTARSCSPSRSSRSAPNVPRDELRLRLRGERGEHVVPGAFLDDAARLELIWGIAHWVLGHVVRHDAGRPECRPARGRGHRDGGELIAGLVDTPSDQLVLRAVVDVARGMGSQTIAESCAPGDGVAAALVRGRRRAGASPGRPEPRCERLPELSGARAQPDPSPSVACTRASAVRRPGRRLR